MKDKDILNMLGLNDRTITLTADDEYLQYIKARVEELKPYAS